MRHVRMLGFCLVAMVALGAMLASSALAIKEPDVAWAKFKNCPIHGEATFEEEVKPAFKCTFGATRKGEGGSYTVGSITVPVTKPILLQGAYTEPEGKTREEHIAHERLGILIPPEDGAPPIVPVAEHVPGEPLANVTEAEMNEFGWPEELEQSYKAAQKHHWFKEGKTTEVIEPAGADRDYVSEFNISSEEGSAIIASIQIQGKNKWLESIGGNCQIGSEADPIVQHLTTGPSESPLTGEIITGTSGIAGDAHEALEAYLTGTVLVDNTYPVPGAEKCGGAANEAYLDPVVNHAFGLPAVAGASKTELIGALYIAQPGPVSEH